MSRQHVNRWGVGLLATVGLTGVGLLYANATLLAAALVPLAYVLYGTLGSLPEEMSLAVSRDLAPKTPTLGERVTVTVTVTNTGDAAVTDLRLVDGVPEALAVTAGSPRLGTALSPGKSRTVEYTVVAKRGVYRFDDPVVRLRSLAGDDRLTRDVAVTGDERLVCATSLSTRPSTERTTPYTGSVTADTGGAGIEFHSTRQYKPGDPVNRIDWRHVAKTGEFITVQFREERTSRVVVLVDVRPVGRVAPAAGYPTAADLSAYAGEQLHDALDGDGRHVSVAAVGLDDVDDERATRLCGPDGLAWSGADAGTDHRNRAEQLFSAARQAATGDACRLPLEPPRRPDANAGASQETNARQVAARTDGGTDVERVLSRVPADAKVFVCSPLLDNWPVALGRALAGRDLAAQVISPDVLGGERPGQRIAAVHRRHRLDTLDSLGAQVVDWTVDEPVEHALRRSLPRVRRYQ